MANQPWSWTKRISLPSRQGAHRPCMQEILECLKQLGWVGMDLFGVELTLEESLSNAIRHGNQFDERKQVSVEWKANPDRFWIRIADEGAGFCPERLPDCTADENLECTSGRGVALIKSMMTHVEYNECGNCLTMEKIRAPATR